MESNTNRPHYPNKELIINLNDEDCVEEIISEWDAEIRNTFFRISDNQDALENYMRKYKKSLEQTILKYDGCEILRAKIFLHTNFFYSYFTDMQCCNFDSYLGCMEEILILYCNVEFDIISLIDKKVCPRIVYKRQLDVLSRRITNLLHLCLLERLEYIFHVLMKIRVDGKNPTCGDVVRCVYKHFLTFVPLPNKQEDTYCRYYILFQRLKEFLPKSEWASMDKFLSTRFGRELKNLEKNTIIDKILNVQPNDAADVALSFFRTYDDLCTSYFKHMSTVNKSIDVEDYELNINFIDDDEDNVLNPNDLKNESDEDDVKFNECYMDLECKLAAVEPPINCAQESDDDDDDIEFISITMLPTSPQNTICPNTQPTFDALDLPLPNLSAIDLHEKETNKEPSKFLDNPNKIDQICISAVVSIDEIDPTTSHQQTESIVAENPTENNPPSELNETNISKSCVQIEKMANIAANELPDTPPSSQRTTTPEIDISGINEREIIIDKCVAENSGQFMQQKSVGLENLGVTTPGTTPPSDVDHDEQTSGHIDVSVNTNPANLYEKGAGNGRNSNIIFNNPTVNNMNSSCFDYMSSSDLYEKIDSSTLNTCGPTPPIDDFYTKFAQEEVTTNMAKTDDFGARLSSHDTSDNNSEKTSVFDRIKASNALQMGNSSRKSKSKSIKNKIDTGQKPESFIDNNKTAQIAESPKVDMPYPETSNGNIVRPNGSKKDDVVTTPKVIYTHRCTNKVPQLKDFNHFESAINNSIDYDFGDVFSGPLVNLKTIPNNKMDDIEEQSTKIALESQQTPHIKPSNMADLLIEQEELEVAHNLLINSEYLSGPLLKEKRFNVTESVANKSKYKLLKDKRRAEAEMGEVAAELNYLDKLRIEPNMVEEPKSPEFSPIELENELQLQVADQNSEMPELEPEGQIPAPKNRSIRPILSGNHSFCDDSERPSSPGDMKSPPYENIDNAEFIPGYTSSLALLRKKKINFHTITRVRIFEEGSTSCEDTYSEHGSESDRSHSQNNNQNKTRIQRGLMQKYPQLMQRTTVSLERIDLIDKAVIERKTHTLRIDFDKSKPQLTNRDRARPLSPLRLTFKLPSIASGSKTPVKTNSARRRNISGKRKNDSFSHLNEESITAKKRGRPRKNPAK